MNDLKISKNELMHLLTKATAKLQEDTMPGESPEKQRSIDFLNEFKEIFAHSQVNYFPMAEIISLLVLENQVTLENLKERLRKAQEISNLSIKIRRSAESNPSAVPELVKIFDNLTQNK